MNENCWKFGGKYERQAQDPVHIYISGIFEPATVFITAIKAGACEMGAECKKTL